MSDKCGRILVIAISIILCIVLLIIKKLNIYSVMNAICNISYVLSIIIVIVNIFIYCWLFKD